MHHIPNQLKGYEVIKVYLYVFSHRNTKSSGRSELIKNVVGYISLFSLQKFSLIYYFAL